GGVALGDLEAAALTGVTSTNHTGENTERPEKRTGVDADGRMLGDRGEALFGDLGFHQPCPDVIRDTVAGKVGVRSGHAITGDRAEHDRRVDLAQALVAESATFEPTGPHGFDDDVGFAYELEVRRDSVLGSKIDDHRSFPPVDVEVHQRNALDDRPGHPADVIARRALDLDDVGAEIGELSGDGGRAEHG